MAFKGQLQLLSLCLSKAAAAACLPLKERPQAATQRFQKQRSLKSCAQSWKEWASPVPPASMLPKLQTEI